MATTSTKPREQEHAISDDPTRSRTLPRRYYNDPEILEAELENIFYKSWLYIGHESQLTEAGSYITGQIYDQNVFLIRGRDEVIRGFYNVCKHRGHKLLEGTGKKPVITCPYHAWAYRLDGSLKSAYGTDTLPDFDPTDYGLTPIRVDSMLGFLFVNLDMDAPTFCEYAPGLEEEIRADVVQIEDLVLVEDSEGLALPGKVACNWKVLVENFQECYHCKPAHKDLCTLFDVANYGTTCYVNFTSATVPHTGKWDNDAYPITPDMAQQNGRFWFIWPNLSFTTIPGTPNISIYRVDPAGPEVTENWTQTFRLADDHSDMNEQRNHWGAHVAGVEDKELCESVQEGMRQRGFSQGRVVHSPDNDPVQAGGEIGVHWHNWKIYDAV